MNQQQFEAMVIRYAERHKCDIELAKSQVARWVGSITASKTKSLASASSSLLAAVTAVAETASASADFEAKHPRNKDGEFTDKGKGSKGPKENKKNENKKNDDVNDDTSMSDEEIQKLADTTIGGQDAVNQEAAYTYLLQGQITNDDFLKKEINKKYPLLPRQSSLDPAGDLYRDTMYDALTTSTPIVHIDDQEKYWKAVAELESKAFLEGEVHDMDPEFHMKTSMEQMLDKTKTVYRGTDAERTLDLLKTGILDGVNPYDATTEKNYSAADEKDFVSATLSYQQALDFADNHHNSVIVKFDITDLKPDVDYHIMDYKLQSDLHVYDPARVEDNRLDIADGYDEGQSNIIYRPDEKFGGSHSARYAKELEVQLKRGITPKISKIMMQTQEGPYIPDEDTEALFMEIQELAKQKGIPVEEIREPGDDEPKSIVVGKRK